MTSRTGASWLHGWLLVAAITSVCSTGNLLFGYDQGVMSGVVISHPWLAQMDHPSTLMIGTITSVYDVGAAAGAIAAAFTGERLGRKRTLILGTSIQIIGTVLKGAAYERVLFMFGRIVTGIGIGYIMSVSPVYQSEISRAAQRGWQVCCQQTTMLFGLMLAYWINYGMYFHAGGVQWRFPVLFQLIFGIYILALTPFLPDTPRWLMRHSPTPEAAIEVLARLRGKSIEDGEVVAEAEAIQEAIEIESKEEGGWKDLFKSNGISAHKRFYLAVGSQFMQQMSGINIVTYYAPTLYQTSLGMSNRMALLMGCFTQLWYIIASFVTWWTIDHVGRRKSFISMAVGMCVVLICEAICVRINNNASAIAAIFFVFAFEACFTWGWMACVWVYPPEILPLKIRAKGAALAAAADFLGNFLVVEITPPALKNIGYRTYIIFAVFNIANAIIVWFFYPETAGLPLESIDVLFAKNQTLPAAQDESLPFYRKFQWSIVAQANMEIRRRKRLRAGVEAGAVESGEEAKPGESHTEKL